ncbi:hypothetical protein BDZ94DRAFT_1275476 [Collybia nuda]|uniref:Uncharacterized protein n=1 Tax=Collybia nuda TaxID=64659 RepID=A0A9P5XT19_9AGAR|nr:hypothetical protein BDZ94DRAFT_1275476 [Collybia nuda]
MVLSLLTMYSQWYSIYLSCNYHAQHYRWAIGEPRTSHRLVRYGMHSHLISPVPSPALALIFNIYKGPLLL